MKHRNYCIGVLLSLLSPALVQSQEIRCASSELFDQAMENPEARQANALLEQDIYQYFLKKHSQLVPESGGPFRTIPVVVHIIHDNGPELLSVSQIQQGIAWVNDALANSGYFDQGSGADTDIRLCLAQRTPDNLNTDGITYTQSSLTNLQYNTQDAQLKSLIRWNPRDYLNIWVVREICNSNGDCSVAGYTTQWANHGAPEDGIVVEARTWGSDINYTPLLLHEIGHYFNLFHTFQYGCFNQDCLLNGDHICDTPPDQSTAAAPCGVQVNSCSTDTDSGPFTSDQPDMTSNYMDYGNFKCMHDFTKDQADRMNVTLSVKRKALLDSKGCQPPCPQEAIAGFSVDSTTIQAGSSLHFNNTSQFGIAFVWSINGQFFTGSQNADYQFNTPGLYTVSLTVYPADQTLCATQSVSKIIDVKCSATASFAFSDDDPLLNQSVQITNNSQGANQFEWFVDGISQGTVLSTLTFAQAGTHDIQLVASNGVCSNAFSRQLTIHGTCDYTTFQNKSVNPVAPYTATDRMGAVELPDGNILTAMANADTLILFKSRDDGSVIWVKNYAGIPFPDVQTIWKRIPMCTTPDTGFALILPSVENAVVDFDRLVKFDATGEMQWGKQFESPGGDNSFLRQVILSNDSNLVVCGGYVSNGLVLGKFNLAGNLVWSKQYNTALNNCDLDALCGNPSGGYFAAGRREGQIILLKLNETGDILWKKSLSAWNISGLPADDNVIDLFCEPDQNAIFLFETGGIMMKFDTNGVKKEFMLPEGYLNLANEPQGYWGMVRDPGKGFLIFGQDETAYKQVITFKIDFDFHVLHAQYFSADFHYIMAATRMKKGGYWLAGKIFEDATNQTKWWNSRVDDLAFSRSCGARDTVFHLTPLGSVFYSHILTEVPPPVEVTAPVTASGTSGLNWTETCAPSCARAQENCQNGYDDDADNLYDCFDPDCNCGEGNCFTKESNIWYFGSAGLNFNFEPPAPVFTGTYAGFPPAILCDENGEVIYFNGKNRIDTPMPGPFSTGTQSLINIPFPSPLSNSRICVIYASSATTNIVPFDMRYDGGFGEAVTSDVISINNPILANAGIYLTRTCPDTYWILQKFQNGFQYYAWKFDPSGLSPVPVNSAGPPGSSLYSDYGKFSPDNRHFAIADIGLDEKVDLFDFNPETGALSNCRFITGIQPPNTSIQGFEFSPNGRYLYTSWYGNSFFDSTFLIQTDLDNPDLSQKLIAKSRGHQADDIQLAPNGTIYQCWKDFSFPVIHLDIIHSPNETATDCQFQSDAVQLVDSSDFYTIRFPGVLASGLYRPGLRFYSSDPDTICELGTSYAYHLHTPYCFFDSITWKLDGLPGNVESYGDSVHVHYNGYGAGKLIASGHWKCGFDNDTLPVFVVPPISSPLNLGPDIIICDNGVAQLDAGAGFSHYRWSTGATDQTLATLNPGKYWVDAWDLCGNVQSDTIEIKIAPESELNLGNDITNKCSDFSQSFHLPPYFSSWTWTPDAQLDCDTCASVSIATDHDMSWVITAQSAFGCISVDTLSVDIVDTLQVQIDTFTCAGTNLFFHGLLLKPDTSMVLYAASTGPACDTLYSIAVAKAESTASLVATTICNNSTFEYQGVQLSPDTMAVFHLVNAAGCDSMIQVVVNSWPDIRLVPPPDTSILIGAAVLFSTGIQASGPVDIAWTPPTGLNCTVCLSPLASPEDTVFYTVWATDQNGCADSAVVKVYVDDVCAIEVPNVFTPNGDGYNDRFRPITDPCVKSIRSWQVINRWGKTVFEARNLIPNAPDNGWDGTWNGSPHPSDVLVWIGEFELNNGKITHKSGEVTLLR